jgi:branched-subunit amino acid aminotransferase/4-amino-4-deoxychorismate lyase
MSFAALYGFSLFETLRTYGGRPFLLDKHVVRMKSGAEELRLGAPELSESVISAVLGANNLSDAAVRMTLVAMGDDWDDLRPSLTVAVRAFEGYPEEWYRDGIDLVVAPWRRCAQDATVGLKSGNYLTCLRAREFAHRAGAQEALLRNCAGQVTEGAVTNLFAVVADGTLVTPPVEDGLLPGVTRAVVLNLAREAGIRAAERSIAPEDLGAFREAFVTNSLMEIVPVRRIGDRPVATCPGETTRLLAEAYSQLH